ncbi:DUF4097 family beta strand repeat-containing protein [Nonomuraea sp. NPDC050404]|uniref:DUF4097 family beta strand repeat-containing protein n=1 Tax=Nonomuraea sp. NPDC050404 TaxID=3155783 RepID=UPI003408A01E
MRALWLTAGAVATAIALLISTASLWSMFASAREPREHTSRSIPLDHKAVQIRTGKGQVDLFITSGQAGELRIDRYLQWSKDRPTVTEDWDERTGTLLLDAVCRDHDQPQGPTCRASYTLFVPPEVDVEAGTVGGAVAADDLFGSVRLTSVAGDIRVTTLSGDLWARTGTGDVVAESLRGERADVEAGSGDLRVTFQSAPSQVRAVVRTSGDVDVWVPRNVYAVTAEGVNTTLSVRHDPDASRKIVATTKDGYVSVCCR